MSHTIAGLRHDIAAATDLQSVVRTMKAIAASSIGQYEQSVLALADYYRTVEIGLGACLRQAGPAKVLPEESSSQGATDAIVFGSDQGLVGQFNEAIAEFAVARLSRLPGKLQVWAVGERVHARLKDAGLTPIGCFALPNSVEGIAPLVGRIQLETGAQRTSTGDSSVYLIYHQPQPATHQPVSLRLLPLDATWHSSLAALPWPTKFPPEVLGAESSTLRALIHEYLFISLFRACAESLASENACRLAAMGRAERNIDDLLGKLKGDFRRLRQEGIDAELFEVIAGYEALRK